MQGSSPARRGDFFVAALVTFLLSADSRCRHNSHCPSGTLTTHEAPQDTTRAYIRIRHAFVGIFVGIYCLLIALNLKAFQKGHSIT